MFNIFVFILCQIVVKPCALKIAMTVAFKTPSALLQMRYKLARIKGAQNLNEFLSRYRQTLN